MSSQSESSFWKTLKWHIEKSGYDVVLTRIENSQTPGIPDLLFCDRKRNLHLIELKVATGWKPKLSPFQISFAVRHQAARAWVLIQKWQKDENEIYLYRADQVMKLMEKGMKEVKPKEVFTLPVGLERFLIALEDF
jgi:hypothetical protein|tara:strand:- start:271 stop:678 length:408 start_codon:yes stop_codon:yes gene_type:complete